MRGTLCVIEMGLTLKGYMPGLLQEFPKGTSRPGYCPGVSEPKQWHSEGHHTEAMVVVYTRPEPRSCHTAKHPYLKSGADSPFLHPSNLQGLKNSGGTATTRDQIDTHTAAEVV